MWYCLCSGICKLGFSEFSIMKRILTSCMDETMEILTTHRDQLDQLTEALVEKETLDDKEIREMFGFEAVKHVTDLR